MLRLLVEASGEASVDEERELAAEREAGMPQLGFGV